MIDKSLTLEQFIKPLAYATLFIGMSLSHSANAAMLTISPENKLGDPVAGFRYIVEQDTMYKATPGVDVQVTPSEVPNSVSFNFHKSHTPVAQNAEGVGLSGETAATESSISLEVPPGNYFVSVLPFEGHAIGGSPVKLDTNGANVKVRVNEGKVPTAQISIQVFEDNSPINGAIDLGERGLNGSLVSGRFQPFHVILEDPAGQYGAGGGRVAYDAYGNPLGTDYNADGSVSSYPAGFDSNGMILNPGALTPGQVDLVPNDQGYLVIKHLPPGKYGVQVVPPAGAGWIQTSTIEGTKVVDAWVKPNEPEVFVEFGPPGPHVFIGFVREYDCNAGQWGDGTSIQLTKEMDIDGVPTVVENDDPDLNPCIGYTPPPVAGLSARVTGTVVDNHMSRSPNFQFNNGTPFPGCRVGVNLGIAGKTIYSGKCDDLSNFEINGLTANDYSLSIYDDGLDAVIANHPFSIAPDATGNGLTVTALTQLVASNTNGSAPNTADCVNSTCALGEIPVFNWFHKLYTSVFYDRDEDGFRDCVTPDCNDPNQDDVTMNADAFASNIRWRDGRIYQSVAIDTEGSAPFDQVFPFFHWLVAETDFAKFKATGATITVDNGGGNATTSNSANNLQANGFIAQEQIGLATCSDTDTNGNPVPGDGLTDPTITECTHDGGWSRTEKGQVLTEAMQGFLGQKSVIEFGKTNYGKDENGGISGMAIYAITRAEHDPRYAAAEIWEPGIPRVQFALYQDENVDEIADDRDGSGGFTAADVDNYPLGWFENGGAPGPEDIDRNGNGTFDYGDAIDVTWSDSWDDSLPENCQGANLMTIVPDNHCMDGMRNWNQIRPGVFDGGYAFPSNPVAGLATGADGSAYLAKGYYIVQGFTPPGHDLLKEEDKNVDFGDEYAVPQLLPPICVGDDHMVPPLMTFVTDSNGVQNVPGDPADYAAPYAGDTRPLCDKKHILLTDGKNAAADFHFFTEVPKASHVIGGILNDLANEFNPNSPTFGEKFAPPWLPVAFYDWTGKEITRVYTDQYGKYNAMLPSTYTANAASPSGFTANMVTACMNDGGYVDHDNDAATPAIIDPNYNPQYTQFCYTFQYMPGATTYLDTPVLQLAAFAGSGYQLDCEAADTTPMIASVTGPNGLVGPYIADQSVAAEANRTLTITSVGSRQVLNPSSNEFTAKFVTRDYGFGGISSDSATWGNVILTGEDGIPRAAQPSSWSDSVITAVVPQNIPDGRYQLTVQHANQNVSPMAVSVIVGPLRFNNNVVRTVTPSSIPGATPIQDAIDIARRGDLILVAPGVYDEQVIMWKPVYLQGAGAFSTTINARAVPAEKVQLWKNKVGSLVNVDFDLLDGQENGPLLFDTEEGPGVLVVSKAPGFANSFNNGNKSSGIDGFTITGASTGGGIFLNGYVNGLDISNNRITGNEGTYGGGIRLGHFALTDNDQLYTNARNYNVSIHHNQVIRNGAQNGAGGGIALYNGSNNYRVTDNLICGNFAATDGAGIGHLGMSTGGRIEDNQIIFNQSFRQTPGFETDGGGILIAGQEPAQGAASGLTDGSGHVRINRNLIQGNQAGAGDGAGIAIRRVNGADIAADPSNSTAGTPWWLITVDNNTIVNNVAGLAGGAISMKDAVRVDIENNTIANNNSTATAGAAFAPGSPSQSTPQIAGIASYHHQTLDGVLSVASGRFSTPYANPLLQSNILWHNQSSYFVLSTTGDLTTDCSQNVNTSCLPSQLIPVANYTDLGVVNAGAGETLYLLRWSTVSDATGYPAGWNLQDADPVFANAYLNGAAGLSPSIGNEFQTIMVAPALDEGGNWIDARYAPLSINDVDLTTPDDQASDYHLSSSASPAVNAGNPNRNRPSGGLDIDLEPGLVGSVIDQGSDEVQ